MNKRSNRHVPEDVLERYAMGRLSGEECEPVEEHLLLCAVCQRSLEQTDEYIRVAQAATAMVAHDSPNRTNTIAIPIWAAAAR